LVEQRVESTALMRAKKLADSRDSLLENYLASHLAFLSVYRMVSMKVDQKVKCWAARKAAQLVD
jgi:hypothetical protein